MGGGSLFHPQWGGCVLAAPGMSGVGGPDRSLGSPGSVRALQGPGGIQPPTGTPAFSLPCGWVFPTGTVLPSGRRTMWAPAFGGACRRLSPHWCQARLRVSVSLRREGVTSGHLCQAGHWPPFVSPLWSHISGRGAGQGRAGGKRQRCPGARGMGLLQVGGRRGSPASAGPRAQGPSFLVESTPCPPGASTLGRAQTALTLGGRGACPLCRGPASASGQKPSRSSLPECLPF